ncbi:MAG TPA: flagellar motor protein MotB [Solirubrobacterales bacterium]|nr:flagellar motor protein MotB [Solirubrobacterales bacterium]
MSAARTKRTRRRGRRRAGGEAHDDNERWLLTYADMITLLMALFMVLFSISSVNVSKFHTLKQTLREAFAPKVLSGAGSILPNGGAEPSTRAPSQQPVPAALPSRSTPELEEDEFLRLKHALDAYARRHGFSASIETMVTARGLVIRLLTDQVLFDSGSAAVKPEADPLLAKISDLVDVDPKHPISVEGNTDNVPISNGRYPSNWELSTARAAAVVRFMTGHGVAAGRLEATGVAGLRPIDTNDTEAGRSRNRRVEIALLRGAAPEGGAPPR